MKLRRSSLLRPGPRSSTGVCQNEVSEKLPVRPEALWDSDRIPNNDPTKRQIGFPQDSSRIRKGLKNSYRTPMRFL
eukprot:7562445-Pyramimonas_sp.AAC.1